MTHAEYAKPGGWQGAEVILWRAMRAGLDALERDLVRRRDWRAPIRHGASFSVLQKLGAVVGVSNLHLNAAMRGESLEAFQRTRNAPGTLHSVAASAARPARLSFTSLPNPPRPR